MGRVFQREVNGKKQKTWTVQYDGPPKANGKRNLKMKGGFATKKEGQAYLTTVESDKLSGTYVEPSKQTVAEYLDYWMRNYVEPNLSGTTVDGYRSSAIKVSAIIGQIQIEKLKATHIQEMYTKFRRQSNNESNTIRKVHIIIKGAFKRAVRWGIIKNNPFDFVDAPKLEKKIHEPILPEKTKELLEDAASSRYFGILYIAFVTGARRSEVCGLRWRDIDFERKQLQIIQAVKTILTKGLVIEQKPKTKTGYRKIDLFDDDIEFLKKHRKNQLKERLVSGSGYQDNDLVFPTETGTPTNPNKVSDWTKRLLTRHGLKNHTFHSTRHFHASLLLLMGVNILVVKERLGHANIQTTLDIYGHLLPTTQKDAATQYGEFFRGVINS